MTDRGHARLTAKKTAPWVAVTLALCVACGGDDEKKAKAGPAGPASIAIVSPADGENVVWAALPSARLPVTVALENWTLRPPGACGSTEQCGYVALFVDGDSSGPPGARAAATVALADLASLPTPAGSHRIRVELFNDDDTPFVGDDGQVVAAEVTVVVVVSDAGTDAGTDAPVDAPTDAPGDVDAGPVDAALDAKLDAAADATSDASVDAPSDAIGDSPTDSAPDAPQDASTEGATDAASDAGGDSTADAPGDSPTG